MPHDWVSLYIKILYQKAFLELALLVRNIQIHVYIEANRNFHGPYTITSMKTFNETTK